MTPRSSAARIAACAVFLMLPTGCATFAGDDGAQGSAVHRHNCMNMMKTDHADQSETTGPHMPMCRMMDKSEPGKAKDADAAHDHDEGSGPFLTGAQAPQAAGQGKDIPALTAWEVVVKFKDDGKVKDIIDAYWKDPAASRARFEVFKRDRPEMAAARLARVTYSNELVLTYPRGARAPAGQPADIRQIAARLASASDISYAEPNLTAHIQH